MTPRPKRQPKQFTLSVEAIALLERMADRRGLTLSATIELLIREKAEQEPVCLTGGDATRRDLTRRDPTAQDLTGHDVTRRDMTRPDEPRPDAT